MLTLWSAEYPACLPQPCQDLLSPDWASGGSCSSQWGSRQQEVLGRTRMASTPARLAPNERASTPIESPVQVQIRPPRTGPSAMPSPFPTFCQPYRVPMGAWPKYWRLITGKKGNPPHTPKPKRQANKKNNYHPRATQRG